ncbi:MAG: hypothetical protein H7203_08945 [Rhizobacter sp.]|nr:hypothetical protein [Burkholderiales bacterium]
MAFFNLQLSSLAAANIAVVTAALSTGCAVVETGASLVKATATVASATVGVASTVVGTTVVAGSAVLSAASAAKSVTVAAVGTAIAAGSLVVVGAQAVAHSNRDDDVAMTSVVATAPDRFSAPDGRRWITQNCQDVRPGQPALWVAKRSGENEIRINNGTRCAVLLLE